MPPSVFDLSRRTCALALFSAALACPDPTPAAESWECVNDLEIACAAGECRSSPADEFTPMSVAFGLSGEMSVCAYTGCWAGVGEVVESEQMVVLIGQDLEFSTAPEPGQGAEDVVIALDRADGVATLKAGAFAHPLLCRRGGATG